MDECIDIPSNASEYGTIIAQINSMFNEWDDVLYTEINTITDHRYQVWILDFKFEYANGNTSWYHITLVTPHDTLSFQRVCYVICIHPQNNSPPVMSVGGFVFYCTPRYVF